MLFDVRQINFPVFAAHAEEHGVLQVLESAKSKNLFAAPLSFLWAAFPRILCDCAEHAAVAVGHLIRHELRVLDAVSLDCANAEQVVAGATAASVGVLWCIHGVFPLASVPALVSLCRENLSNCSGVSG